MCIAVTWPATRRAKLAAVFEIFRLTLTYYVFAAGDSSSHISMAASGLALAGDYLLILGPWPVRPLAATLCGVGAGAHVLWSASVEGSRRNWERVVSAACASGASAMHLDHASELHELAMLSVTGMDAEQLRAATESGVAEQLATVAQMREAGIQPVGGQRRMQPAMLCQNHLSNAALGSLPELLIAAHVIGGVVVLLNLLTAAKVWLEDTPTGRRFDKRLREEYGATPSKAKREPTVAEACAVPVAVPVAVATKRM